MKKKGGGANAAKAKRIVKEQAKRVCEMLFVVNVVFVYMFFMCVVHRNLWPKFARKRQKYSKNIDKRVTILFLWKAEVCQRF